MVAPAPLLPLLLVTVAATVTSALGQQPAAEQPNRADEPTIRKFSLKQAVRFSDTKVQQWERQQGCVTCHTNGLYLVARAEISTKSSSYRRARQFTRDYLNRYVVDKQAPSGQRGAVEGLVATTCFMALSDMKTHKRLTSNTRKALDHMWALQDEDGAWSQWLKCGWPPYESDDHFGATLAAVAVSVLPESYARTDPAAGGIKRLLKWLQDNPPQNLHHKGMMLWAASNMDGLVDAPTKRRWAAELVEAQRSDGGWRLVDLGAGEWKRSGDDRDALPSDAYATAFAVFALRQAATPRDHESIRTGLAWLRRDQRRSGRWFVRSPKRDGKHFISHAATLFAVMAFRSCGEKL